MKFYRIEGPSDVGLGHGDGRYEAYHGAAKADFFAPGLLCACLGKWDAVRQRKLGRVAVRPRPATARVNVPEAMRAAWPSLDGFQINRGNERMRGPLSKTFSASAHGSGNSLVPSEWNLWSQRFATLALDGSVPETLRPSARLSPVVYRRLSKKPFSVLFPFASVPGAYIVSSALREAVERLDAQGVQFTELFHTSSPAELFTEASLMEATLESPINNTLLSECKACGTTVFEAPSGLSRSVLEIDFQVGESGIVLSERVSDGIREICAASLVPPLFRELEF